LTVFSADIDIFERRIRDQVLALDPLAQEECEEDRPRGVLKKGFAC